MKKQRQKFSSEFKVNAAKLILEQEMATTKVAQDLVFCPILMKESL